MNTTKKHRSNQRSNQRRNYSMDTDSMDNLYGGFLECAKEENSKELNDYLEEVTDFAQNH